MTALVIDDHVLDFTEHVSGDLPLIFVHGIASSQQTWLTFPLRFAQYGRIITLSLPGHYPARFPAGMRQTALSDSWVGDLLAEAVQKITGGVPALLVGHSTGGYAALAVAWRAPHLVKGVISLAGFVRGKWGGLLGMSQRLRMLGIPGKWLFDTLFTINMHSPVLIDLIWQSCFSNGAAFRACVAYHTARPALMADLSRMDVNSLRLWFYQMRAAGDLTPHLSEITVPVLAIAGKSDGVVPAEQAVVIGQGVARGTTLLLDTLDHALYMEQPEAVARAMMEWIDTIM